jgi:single-stranded-DNA-specific exonuclease
LSAVEALPLDAALAPARADARRFIEALPRAARVVVFCHFDADGLAAGTVAGRALPRLGLTDVRVVSSGKGESAFGEAARTRLAALAPDALVVTDLASTPRRPPGVPTLYVITTFRRAAPRARRGRVGIRMGAGAHVGVAHVGAARPAGRGGRCAHRRSALGGCRGDDQRPGREGTLAAPRRGTKQYTAKWLKEAVSLSTRRGARARSTWPRRWPC